MYFSALSTAFCLILCRNAYNRRGGKRDYSQFNVALILLLIFPEVSLSSSLWDANLGLSYQRGDHFTHLKLSKHYHVTTGTQHIFSKKPLFKALWVLPDNKKLPSEVFLTLLNLQLEIWYYVHQRKPLFVCSLWGSPLLPLNWGCFDLIREAWMPGSHQAKRSISRKRIRGIKVPQIQRRGNSRPLLN